MILAIRNFMIVNSSRVGALYFGNFFIGIAVPVLLSKLANLTRLTLSATLALPFRIDTCPRSQRLSGRLENGRPALGYLQCDNNNKAFPIERGARRSHTEIISDNLLKINANRISF